MKKERIVIIAVERSMISGKPVHEFVYLQKLSQKKTPQI